jgi:type VI secretion system protein ImpA
VTNALESLLAPVSAENECGEDITYDASFLELEKLLVGKPETQFSPGEPPEWKQIREGTIGLLGRSKNLRLVLMLIAAQVRVEGFAGFRDGLDLLKRFVEKWWPNLYPRLDTEENNDPIERVNIIASLAVPPNTVGDQLRILEGLQAAPLCRSRQYGSYGWRDIADSRAGVKSTKTRTIPGPSDIEAAFRDTEPAVLQASNAAITEALTLIKALDQLLDSLVGNEKARDLAPLVAALGELGKLLAPYVPASAAPAEAAPAQEASGRQSANAGGPPTSVESRQQVVQALDLICNYYARYEPSSPVPLLLQRARRLVDSDFLGIVADLSPETLDKVRAAAGIPKQ